MIGPLWTLHRKALLVGVALCLSVGCLIGLVALDRGSRPTPGSTGPSSTHAFPRIDAPTKQPSPRAGSYHPRYVLPPQTSAQTRLASALAAAESSGQIAAAQAVRLPAGRYSAQFPAMPGRDESDEFSYARAWTVELLDVHYRSQSRAELLAWATAGEAADTLPGVPSNVEDKSLYLSLADPTLDGVTTPTPLPAAVEWRSMATNGVVQRVSSIEVSVDPAWTRLVGEGFVPDDPLLSFVDVSGTMTTTGPVRSGLRPDQGAKRASVAPRTKQFRLVLTVGSALHHPGYGAVGVSDWSVR